MVALYARNGIVSEIPDEAARMAGPNRAKPRMVRKADHSPRRRVPNERCAPAVWRGVPKVVRGADPTRLIQRHNLHDKKRDMLHHISNTDQYTVSISGSSNSTRFPFSFEIFFRTTTTR